jgi:hypothetical protein
MMKMRRCCFYKELWSNLFKLWKLKFVRMVTIGWGMHRIYHKRGSLGMNAHLWTILFLHQCMVRKFWGVSIRQINLFMKVIQCHNLKINAERGFLNMFVSLDYMHYRWKNCAIGWQGEISKQTLKEVDNFGSNWRPISSDMACIFGFLSGNNDINVLE